MSNTTTSRAKQAPDGAMLASAMYAKFHADAKKALEEEEMYYRVIALPICFGELIWDFADTVCNQCRILKDPDFKPIPRRFTELRKFYNAYYKLRGITEKHLAPLISYKESYITDPNGVGAVYEAIYGILKRKYPDIAVDYLMLYTVIWQIQVFSKALKACCFKAEADLSRRIHMPNFGSVLPQEILSVSDVIRPFCQRVDIGKDNASEIIKSLVEEMNFAARGATEPSERTMYRRRCIGFVCNGGCKFGAVGSEKFGCYPSTECKRMKRYDKKHNKNERNS